MMMNAERTILHCDCNSFFASVELLEHPELRDRPVAVAGDPEGRHGIILAKNMPAKKFGIQTAETVWQAKRKCPELVLLPPHHEKYRDMSRRINAIYLDVTDQVEPFSVDESWLDVTGSRTLFGDGKTIADLLRRRVREETGVTISVGVSDNKTWAKMGSDYKKPDATTVITRENVRELLYPLPVQDFLFVGQATAQTLAHMGVNTVGQLAECTPEALTRLLGKQGEGLWRMVDGMDDSPVRWWGDVDAAKSIGRGETFPRDLVGYESCRAGLLPLCESVGAQLRRQGLKARTVTLQIKNPQLKVISRQRTLEAPTSLTQTIYQVACGLLETFWRKDAPVRLMTVTASTLTQEGEETPMQLSFLEDVPADDPRRLRLESTIDRVRDRFGKAAVRRGGVVMPDPGGKKQSGQK